MSWRSARIVSDGTHHVVDGVPLYLQRFQHVLAFHEPGLAPVAAGGVAWHIDAAGHPAYSQRFRQTFGFYEGRAAVEGEGGWHHILTDGTAQYSERYEWCGNSQGGLCTVRRPDGRYCHLDANGRPAYAESWRYAGDYRDGIAVVQGDEGRHTHIDTAGNLLHGQWFLDLDVFHKGFARARDDFGWHHVDVAGQPVYARRFAMVEPFYNGQARVERLDGALEVIDELGQLIHELRGPRQDVFASLSADLVGHWRTDTIAAAVKLGVFDQLPTTPNVLDATIGLASGRALRLLRALGELGLVSRCGGVWDATERGAFLRSNHPMSLADAALEYAGPLRDSWCKLDTALRSLAWEPTVFAQAGADSVRLPGFHRMLSSYARHDYGALVPLMPIRPGETVMDVGGGAGVLAALVAEHFQSSRVVVVDRQEVTALCVATIEAIACDFFGPLPIQADVAVLARVLHDWDDARAQDILGNVRAALRPGGRVVILELLVSADSYGGGLCDMHLLAVTGGRERSREQFQALLASAGLELKAVLRPDHVPALLVAEVA